MRILITKDMLRVESPISPYARLHSAGYDLDAGVFVLIIESSRFELVEPGQPIPQITGPLLRCIP